MKMRFEIAIYDEKGKEMGREPFTAEAKRLKEHVAPVFECNEQRRPGMEIKIVVKRTANCDTFGLLCKGGRFYRAPMNRLNLFGFGRSMMSGNTISLSSIYFTYIRMPK